MVAAFVCTLLASKFDLQLKPISHLNFAIIDEMSGIAKSRRFANTYWVENDSGDSARIFAIRKDGSVVMPADQTQNTYTGIHIKGATNFDWEDLAIEGKTLYISDTGNNLNFRTDLCVYAITEPDPTKTNEVTHFKKYTIAYPDQTEFPPSGPWNFDCEALSVWKGKLFFVSKWRMNAKGFPGDGAAIYVVDKPKTDTVNILRKLDVNTSLGGWVTAADISPDGKTLAVLVQAPKQSVWLFDMTKGEKILSRPVGRIVFSKAKQCEAICWDSNDRLIVSNEQSEIFEIERPVPTR
jgi:hypothetical protein